MTNVISVRFRGGCKTYYFDPRELTVQDGDDVIVETNQGLEFVHCTPVSYTHLTLPTNSLV